MIDCKAAPTGATWAILNWIAKVVAACMLSASALGWVAANSGPRFGTVVVHVAEADVEVSVGPNAFPIAERRQAPFVYELPAGRHSLRMHRQGVLLYQEDFDVIPGDEVVLTAWSTPMLCESDSMVERPTEPDPVARLVVP